MLPKPIVIQAFTVSQSLLFIDGQPAFLAQYGYDVHVVSAGGKAATDFAERQRIRHHAVPFTRRVTPARDLCCLLKIYWLFRRLKPRIVHGNTPKAGLISMLAAWLLRVPVRIYEIHGFPFETRRGLSRTALVLFDRLACQLATQVLAVSVSVQRVALAEGIVSVNKISVLHHGSCNGVDAAERLNPARIERQKLAGLKTDLRLPGRVIGFVGRLTRDKGIYELLEAWSVIRVAYPDVTLLLAGDAEPDFSAHSVLHRDDRIRAVGHVTDLPCHYALMDFLVLPTYREGFSTVLLEAAAMERPAVVSRVTGTVDLLADGETGLFCDPRSVESLIRQISWYLDNSALVRQHGRHARRRILTDFVPADVQTAKWQLYERLLANAGLSINQETAS